MSECICVNCPKKCYEYESSFTSDKAYYEWTYKEDKCKKEAIDTINKEYGNFSVFDKVYITK